RAQSPAAPPPPPPSRKGTRPQSYSASKHHAHSYTATVLTRTRARRDLCAGGFDWGCWLLCTTSSGPRPRAHVLGPTFDVPRGVYRDRVNTRVVPRSM